MPVCRFDLPERIFVADVATQRATHFLHFLFFPPSLLPTVDPSRGVHFRSLSSNTPRLFTNPFLSPQDVRRRQHGEGRLSTLTPHCSGPPFDRENKCFWFYPKNTPKNQHSTDTWAHYQSIFTSETFHKEPLPSCAAAPDTYNHTRVPDVTRLHGAGGGGKDERRTHTSFAYLLPPPNMILFNNPPTTYFLAFFFQPRKELWLHRECVVLTQ